MLPLRKILCPTDFSPASVTTLKLASEWAIHFDAALWVLHAVPPFDHPELELDSSSLESALKERAAEQLQYLIEQHVPGVRAVHPLVASGSPADEIASTAWQERIDMIIIATHGARATALSRAATGSKQSHSAR